MQLSMRFLGDAVLRHKPLFKGKLMTEYHWTGIDSNGIQKTGRSFAPSVEFLRQDLYEQGIALLQHKQPRLKRLLCYRIKSTTIALPILASFFEHIGILLENGIPLIKALKTCADQTSSPELKEFIYQLIPDVEKGKNFAQAFQTHAPYLPFYVQSLIAIGNQTGSLAIICKNLSEHLNASQALKQRVKSTLTVPVITAIFAVVITFLILVFIVPHFEKLFHSSRMSLPVITQRIFLMSSAIRSPLGIGIISFLGFGLIMLPRFIPTVQLRKWIYSFGSIIPYIKNILNLSNALTFLETLNLYSKAGLPLIQSLEAAQILITHPAFNAGIRRIITLVTQGTTLEQALKTSSPSLCSPTVISLIGVGLQTGNIGLMLEKSVIWQRSELSKKLEMASMLANPILMIIIGCIITTLLITIYLPIFNMALIPPL